MNSNKRLEPYDQQSKQQKQKKALSNTRPLTEAELYGWLYKARTELRCLLMWTEHYNDKQFQARMKESYRTLAELDAVLKKGIQT